jgi:hypothetical protein
MSEKGRILATEHWELDPSLGPAALRATVAAACAADGANAPNGADGTAEAVTALRRLIADLDRRLVTEKRRPASGLIPARSLRLTAPPASPLGRIDTSGSG